MSRHKRKLGYVFSTAFPSNFSIQVGENVITDLANENKKNAYDKLIKSEGNRFSIKLQEAGVYVMVRNLICSKRK